MFGIFTATESAAIACAYAIIIGRFIYKELTWKKMWDLCIDTAKMTGIVLIVLSFATLFTWYLTINLIPQQLAASIKYFIDSKIILLLIINFILLIAGTMIDTISALVIFVPLFLPLVMEFGIDPIHFGIIVAINLTIGMCTPPVAVCLFVASSIAKISIREMIGDLIPLLVALLIILFVVTYIPQTVMFLPNLFE
jgi:C4-dicarboxylate transporter DctM subunit